MVISFQIGDMGKARSKPESEILHVLLSLRSMQTKGFRHKAQTLIVLFLCCLSMGFSLHPFYLSVTEIVVAPKEKSKVSAVKVSCKLFLDDAQKVLSAQHQQPVQLMQQTPEHTRMLQEYILSHLHIGFGKTQVALHGIGYEIEGDAVWCYLEGEVKQPGKQCTVFNDLLCGEYPGQNNITHFEINGQRQSNRMDCSKTQLQLNF